MSKSTAIHPTIAELLEEFFGAYRRSADQSVRTRTALVREHLARHLEAEGPNELTNSQLALLEADRQFNPDGAFARTMHAAELYYVLSRYALPQFAMAGSLQRHAQLDVTSALAAHLWARRLISPANVSECAVIEFDIAMERARRERSQSAGTVR